MGVWALPVEGTNDATYGHHLSQPVFHLPIQGVALCEPRCI